MNTVSPINNLSFGARCPEIRLGDNVCRAVRREFPSMSLTKMEYLVNKNSRKCYKTMVSPSKLMMMLINYNYDKPCYHNNPTDDLKFVIDYVKEHKKGDCEELAILTDLVLKLNGIKDSLIGKIKIGKEDFDHTVCFIPAQKGRKPIILDTWADKCEFADKMLREYKDGVFAKYFAKSKLGGEMSVLDVERIEIPDSELEQYKKMFPNLILK